MTKYVWVLFWGYILFGIVCVCLSFLVAKYKRKYLAYKGMYQNLLDDIEQAVKESVERVLEERNNAKQKSTN